MAQSLPTGGESHKTSKQENKNNGSWALRQIAARNQLLPMARRSLEADSSTEEPPDEKRPSLPYVGALRDTEMLR